MIARRAVLVGVMLLWGQVSFAADPAGQVAALEGVAEVTRAGATQPIKAGDPVFVGDKLKTAAGAKLRLLLKDDSVLTLAAGTELVLTEQDLGADQAKSSLGLLGGTMRALVTERYGTPGSKFEVETPTAIAGVRGTGFVISYDASSGTTTVVGLFDTTWVRGKRSSEEVTVGPNRSTQVRKGGSPARPGAVDAPRLQRLVDATDARADLEDESPPRPIDGVGASRRGVPPPRRRGGGRSDGPGGVVDQPVKDIIKKQGPVPPVAPPAKPPPPPPGNP